VLDQAPWITAERQNTLRTRLHELERAASAGAATKPFAADVDRLYRELTAAGAHGYKEPWDAFWGQRYAQVHDPDGNVVDLFAPLD